MVDLLERQIILTLAYSAQFNFPLTAEEVWQRLLAGKLKQEISKKQVLVTLKHLANNGLVTVDRSLFSISPVEQWVDRRVRKQYAQAKLQEANELGKTLQKIPWILAVGVSGSVAARNTMLNDDLDLIVITQKKHLWISRLLVTMYAYKVGKRRSWNHEEQNSWCFNLWLEADQLAFRPATNAVYVAYELCQVEWLFQRKRVLTNLFSANSWVAKILPTFYKHRAEKSLSVRSVPLSNDRFAALTIVLNELSFLFQRIYMHPHMTRERVTKSLAFFHPRDTASDLTIGWKDTLIQWKAYATKI